jgi:hypothetical protein
VVPYCGRVGGANGGGGGGGGGYSAAAHSGIGRPKRHAYVFSSYSWLPTPSSPSALPCSKYRSLAEAKHLGIVPLVPPLR